MEQTADNDTIVVEAENERKERQELDNFMYRRSMAATKSRLVSRTTACSKMVHVLVEDIKYTPGDVEYSFEILMRVVDYMAVTTRREFDRVRQDNILLNNRR